MLLASPLGSIACVGVLALLPGKLTPPDPPAAFPDALPALVGREIRAHSRFTRRAEANTCPTLPPLLPYHALLAIQTPPLSFGKFRREPAGRPFDRYFAPGHTSQERVARQHPYAPPPAVRRALGWAWPVHVPFGSGPHGSTRCPALPTWHALHRHLPPPVLTGGTGFSLLSLCQPSSHTR